MRRARQLECRRWGPGACGQPEDGGWLAGCLLFSLSGVVLSVHGRCRCYASPILRGHRWGAPKPRAVPLAALVSTPISAYSRACFKTRQHDCRLTGPLPQSHVVSGPGFD